MREPAFIKQNADRWKHFEGLMQGNNRHKTTPDEKAE